MIRFNNNIANQDKYPDLEPMEDGSQSFISYEVFICDENDIISTGFFNYAAAQWISSRKDYSLYDSLGILKRFVWMRKPSDLIVL